MSNEQFTKGKWEYIDSVGEVWCGDELICATMPTGSIEYESNAALIAAAPELFDDIKTDIEWLKRLRSLFVLGSDGFRSCSLRIESKEKLLAKARGEA